MIWVKYNVLPNNFIFRGLFLFFYYQFRKNNNLSNIDISQVDIEKSRTIEVNISELISMNLSLYVSLQC